MTTAQLEIGRLYAYRQKRAPREPLIKVKVVAKVGRGGKIKVRHEDGPLATLEEFVSSRNIVVPWGQRRAFVRDEERQLELEAYLREHNDRIVSQAVSEVLEASGEPEAYVGETGYACVPGEQLQRIADRASVEGALEGLHSLGFKDREGYIHLPLEAVEMIARAFAAAEPETVMLSIQQQEDELRTGGYEPGYRHRHDRLRENMPAFALVKQWCGPDQQGEALRAEVARLRGLVSRAASDLRAAGAERKAYALTRALDGR